MLKAAPALKLDDDDDLRIYPYERPLPDPDAPLALVGAVAAAPTMRRPRCGTDPGSRKIIVDTTLAPFVVVGG